MPPAADPREFVLELRRAVERYLQAIDQWEAEYQKYYRLAANAARLSVDLEPVQEKYAAARAELERMVPRARQLSRRFDLADPWPGLLHVRLGARAPQTGASPALGQGERTVVFRCITEMEERLSLDAEAPAEPAAEAERPKNAIARILDYFL